MQTLEIVLVSNEPLLYHNMFLSQQKRHGACLETDTESVTIVLVNAIVTIKSTGIKLKLLKRSSNDRFENEKQKSLRLIILIISFSEIMVVSSKVKVVQPVAAFLICLYWLYNYRVYLKNQKMFSVVLS